MLLTSFAHAEPRPPVASLLERRHDNLVVQEWDLSCGAAALATLLIYQHQDHVTEREVALGLIAREEYLENPELLQLRQGFSLLDMKRYVATRGHEGVGFGRLDLDDLLAKAPIIVPVNFEGYNHFVVFRGKAGDRVLLADPAYGNRTMPVRRFLKSWIDYGEVGRIGFIVRRPGEAVSPPHALAPRLDEFYMLN